MKTFYDELSYKGENFLSHHGILGMKWGKKNGPPYPLEPGQFSKSEMRDGKAYEKALNRASKDLAQKRYDTFIKDKRAVKLQKKVHKAEDKLDRAGHTGRGLERADKRLQKAISKRDAALKDLESYVADVNRGKAKIYEILKEANDKGYTFNEKFVRRVVRERGANLVKQILLASSIGIISLPTMERTKYKLR